MIEIRKDISFKRRMDFMLKYQVIANEIRSLIVDGIYPSNSKLPLEKELQEQYNVSRITVKKAYDILVEEGLVIKQRGNGTFVKNLSTQSTIDLARTRQFLGYSATNANKNVQTDVILFEVVQPNEEVQSKLQITHDEWVYHFTRVRSIEGNQQAMEYTYMPMSTIPGITLDILKHSIYDYIENTLKLKIKSAHRILSARHPKEEEATYLHLQLEDVVMNIEEITFLDNGQPFSYTNTIQNAKEYQYVTVSMRNY